MSNRIQRGRSMRVVITALALFGFIAAYVLSPSPLYYLNAMGYLSGPSFDFLRSTLYAPCIALVDVNDLYARYIYWWIDVAIEAAFDAGRSL